MDVYYYIPYERVNHVVGCGMKLSEWFDREIIIGGEIRKCISTWINPRDDMEKYKSDSYKCIKIEIEPKYCYMADRFLYEAAEISKELLEVYINSLVSVETYVFGTYRLPECLITTTIISEQIKEVDKRLGFPVLFESSEKLYVSNIMELYKEENDNFHDTLLYYFYNKLAEFKKIDKIEDKEKRVAIFFDRLRDKTFCVRIPNEEELDEWLVK